MSSMDIPKRFAVCAGRRRSRGAGILLLALLICRLQASAQAQDAASAAAAPRFEFVPNAVAYPGDDPKVVVRLAGGKLSAPAALRYKLLLQTPTPEAARFLPAAAMAGVLQFRPGEEQRQVPVPVAWQRVPPEAQLRVGMKLEGVHNAAAAPQAGDVALHVFGVAQGTCPPGAALRRAPGKEEAKQGQGQGWWEDTALYAASPEQEPSADEAFVALFAGGEAVALSGRLQAGTSRLDYGAMVPAAASNATLCVRAAAEGQRVEVVAADASAARPQSVKPDDACRCRGADGGGCGAGAGALLAWQLALQPGQNVFNITAAAAARGAEGGARASSSSSSRQALAVVRLADRAHAELASLQAKGLEGGTIVLCGPPEMAAGADAAGDGSLASLMRVRAAGVPAAAGTASAPAAAAPAAEGPEAVAALQALRRQSWEACKPGVSMSVELPASVGTVSVAPQLLHPEVKGARVEVNGQVLSRGGELWADRLADTTAARVDNRTAAGFLPAAFVMGMQPGVEVSVEVVVIAEDGVTSALFPVTLVRKEAKGGAGAQGSPAAAAAAAAAAGGVVTYESPTTAAQNQQRGWPQPPALDPKCTVCPAGWASTIVDAPRCVMCPPGSFSAEAQSPSCSACPAGTYAYSWGATQCKHCIAGTAAADAGATLCRMCPANLTTASDGQRRCNVTVAPATDLSMRYAVVVQFSVYLTGMDPEDVVLKSGVNAPASAIVETLLRVDTAAGFNISTQDVRVLGVRRVARRTLQANVSATLGVELPAGASQDEVSAALQVEKLSADTPIELLSQDPAAFFGRTTQTLDVGVQPFGMATVESRPGGGGGLSKWALVVPGAAALVGGAALVWAGCRRSARCAPARRRAAAWASTMPWAPAAQRYVRQP